MINLKVRQPEKEGDYTTYTFSGKKFFDEGVRLTLNPEEVNNSPVHPIYRYVPIDHIDDKSPRSMTRLHHFNANRINGRHSMAEDQRIMNSNYSLVSRPSTAFQSAVRGARIAREENHHQ